MPKKVAVLVKDNQEEGLRMAVGLTLGDHEVNVFLIDKKLESSENNDLNIETLNDMGAKIFSNTPENNFEQVTTEDIARLLPDYDVVIPY